MHRAIIAPDMVNFFRSLRDQRQSDPREDAMTEFADIFANNLSAIVFTTGTLALLTIGLLATAWANHVPSRVSALELAPAFGM
jgi:hypothetical protein